MSDNQTPANGRAGPAPSSFSIAAQRDSNNSAQPRPDLPQPVIATTTYVRRGDTVELLEHHISAARESLYTRMTSAFHRARARPVPASGTFGVLGSVDDTICPPPLYDWMLLMIHGEAHRWEATTAVKPRCLFCNARRTNLDAHVEEVHAAKWRDAMLTQSEMTPQDLIGMYFFAVAINDTFCTPLTEEEEAAVRNLFEAHNHLSFIQPGDPFPIMHDWYIPLWNVARKWALGPAMR